jgi:Ala-tRNA(Pro) deacylase
MVVMPAHFKLVPQALCEELAVEHVELATEREFKRQFPRCEVGAIPPFGHLFGLRAFMINAFDEFGDVFCKAGTHDEILRMPASEFRRMARLDVIERGASIRLRGSLHSRLQRLLNSAREQPATIRPPLLKQMMYSR